MIYDILVEYVNWTWEWIPAIILGVPAISLVGTVFAVALSPVLFFWEAVFKFISKPFRSKKSPYELE